jgi:hypothetical protein
MVTKFWMQDSLNSCFKTRVPPNSNDFHLQITLLFFDIKIKQGNKYGNCNSQSLKSWNLTSNSLLINRTFCGQSVNIRCDSPRLQDFHVSKITKLTLRSNFSEPNFFWWGFICHAFIYETRTSFFWYQPKGQILNPLNFLNIQHNF